MIATLEKRSRLLCLLYAATLFFAAAARGQEAVVEPVPAPASDALFDNSHYVAGEPVADSVTDSTAAAGDLFATEDAAAKTSEDSNAIDEKLVVELMEDARQAMFEHNYNRAIKDYLQLVEMPDHVYRRDALEALGIAYERNGDFAAAKSSYQRYIQLYPQSGDNTDRVRQRLAGLVTAEWDRPKKPVVKPKQDDWRTYGSLYQLMRRSGSSFNDGGTIIGQHMIITTVDVNSRGHEGAVDIKSRVNGSYLYDLQDAPKDHQRRLGYLYLDLAQRSSGLYGRVGRQRASGGGVLGRFDGVNVGLRFNPEYAMSVVAGFPVDRTSDVFVNHLRRFQGVSIEGGPWNKNWLANGYYIQQTSEGYLDREAVGMELRYMHPRRSLYTLLDYDIHFKSLNIFSSQMTVTTETQTIYNLLLDYRNSPPLSSRSALMGQSVTTLAELRQSYSEAEIAQIAKDRTPHYGMANASFSHPLNEQLSWEADVTVSKVSSTVESAGVPASTSTPAEYYYSTRLNATNYFMTGDVHIIGLNIVDGSTYRMTTLLFNSRLPMGESWYVNPRFQLGYRHRSETGDMEHIHGVGLRVEYSLFKSMTLELDCSSDWNEIETMLGQQTSQSFYVTAGYRLMF